MSDPTSMSSAANAYKKLVPQPVRSVATSTVPVEVRRKVKRQLARTLSRREARLHRRALRRVRKVDFQHSERRVQAPDGRVGHVHTGLTVDFSRRLDHELVTAALDAADIPWFAVPALDDRRICLAVEQKEKGAVRRVLRALLEEHTGYVVSVSPANNETEAVPGSHIKAWKNYGKARVIRLTWLRTDPTENFWVGEDQGVEIEFWTPNHDLPQERLVGPRPNRVQRVVPVDAPGIEVGLERFSSYCDVGGDMEPTVTLENFDIPRLEEITFPIDAVLLWRHATGWGEELLRASLRSLHQYAPWIDLVHVVMQTAGEPPAWLRVDDRLRLIRAEWGIEWQLHLLPDLAENFLLLRPGALLGRPVRPFDYFTPHGTTRPRRGPWTPQESFEAWARAAYSATGKVAVHGYGEGPQPYKCEIFGKLAAAGVEMPPTQDAQLVPRASGTYPMDGLLHHVAHVAGLAEPSGEGFVALHAALPTIANHLDRLLVRRDTQHIQFFGLGSDQALRSGGTKAVTSFLRRYLPVPSVFEREGHKEPVSHS